MQHRYQYLLRRNVIACMECGDLRRMPLRECTPVEDSGALWDAIDGNLRQEREWSLIAEGSYGDLA